MATDMTITLNALTDKGYVKDLRRASEIQPVSDIRGVAPADRSRSVKESADAGDKSARLGVVPRQELEGAVNQMKGFAQSLNRELQFDLDEDLGRTVVRVVDRDSGDLIRQIPSDEILALAKQMKEMSEAAEGNLEGKGMIAQNIGLLVKMKA